MERQHSFDLTQLRVDLLQLRRLAGEDVEPEVVADRHLICEPAEVPLELGQLVREAVATLSQIAVRAHSIVVALLPPPGALLSSGGAGPGVAISFGSFALSSE